MMLLISVAFANITIEHFFWRAFLLVSSCSECCRGAARGGFHFISFPFFSAKHGMIARHIYTRLCMFTATKKYIYTEHVFIRRTLKILTRGCPHSLSVSLRKERKSHVTWMKNIRRMCNYNLHEYKYTANPTCLDARKRFKNERNGGTSGHHNS